MAEENNYYKGIWTLAFFFIMSTVFVAISMIMIVATNDYILYYFDSVIAEMETNGILAVGLRPLVENIADIVVGMLNYVDKFWAISFLLFIIAYIRNSFMSKREGYVSMFGFISFGVMASLFMLNFLVEYQASINDLFFNKILANVSTELTLFNLYVSNFQIVNLVLICVGLLINFIPFDINKFRKRKDEDLAEV